MKYLDPSLSTGLNDGSSPTNAWQNWQAMANNVSSGDDVLVTGTETLTTAVVMQLNAASFVASNRITITGTNSSFVDDGTSFATLDADGVSVNCLKTVGGGCNLYFFKNIEFINASSSCVVASGTSYYWSFDNCKFNGSGLDGYGAYSSLRNSIFIRCDFKNNSRYGAYTYLATIKESVCSSNGSYGCLAFLGHVENSVFWDNLYGLYLDTTNGRVSGNVFFENTQKGLILAGRTASYVDGNRFVNEAIAIDVGASLLVFTLSNYFNGNTTDVNLGSNAIEYSLSDDIPPGIDGFTDSGGGDFTSTPSATGRRTVRNVGAVGSPQNKFFVSSGLIPDDLEVPGVPETPQGILATPVDSGSIKVSCDFVASATSLSFYRSASPGGVFVLQASGVEDFEWIDAGLTSDTNYYYKIKALNGSGSSTFSESASSKTLISSSIPAQTVLGDLVQSIKSKLENIDTVKEVVVGEYESLENKSKDQFPCIEIWIDEDGGQEYSEQVGLIVHHRFIVFVHTYAESPDRRSGKDMEDLSKITSSVKRQVFELNESARLGSPPCDGFESVLGDYTSIPEYQLVYENINTSESKFGVQVVTDEKQL